MLDAAIDLERTCAFVAARLDRMEFEPLHLYEFTDLTTRMTPAATQELRRRVTIINTTVDQTSREFTDSVVALQLLAWNNWSRRGESKPDPAQSGQPYGLREGSPVTAHTMTISAELARTVPAANGPPRHGIAVSYTSSGQLRQLLSGAPVLRKMSKNLTVFYVPAPPGSPMPYLIDGWEGSGTPSTTSTPDGG